MFCLKSFVDDVLSSILPSDTEIKYKEEKSVSEVDLRIVLRNESKKLKIMEVGNIKEKMLMKFQEYVQFFSKYCDSFTTTFHLDVFGGNIVVLERIYYVSDLEEIIHNETLSSSDMCRMMCRLSDILMIISEYDITVGHLKSSNIIYDNYGEIKLCDLFLNVLRKEEMRIYDVCFKSPEELNGLECDVRSVIWSIGCILYEMICKKLPFAEDDNVNKTLDNIVRCKYSLDAKCDEMMKEMIERILKVKSEERLSLKELRKKIIKMSEILRDKEDNLKICEERKEMLYKNDNVICKLPILYPQDYYLQSEKWIDIRDWMIECYNNKPNERILSILLMMKLYKDDKSIKDKLKFQIHHQCKKRKEYCLDEKIFEIGIGYDKERIEVDQKCFCVCEEGLKYMFRILKLINPKKLKFCAYVTDESLFASCFSILSKLKELDLSNCNLSSYFIESFIKSDIMMKLKHVYLYGNPVGQEGFKLLLPYLHLLTNVYNNELMLREMNLNDESMILLSKRIYKYPNIERIDIEGNNSIHSKGLKALFFNFPISKMELDINLSYKELLIDKDIPELVKYIVFPYCPSLHLYDSEIDDDFIKSFIMLRLNEMKNIYRLDLSNNKLTYKSVKMLVNNLPSFSTLRYLELGGNEIGDEGMKLLSPHLHLLISLDRQMSCSKMGISSTGLKYLIDYIKNDNNKIWLDLSYNNIDLKGIEYLIECMKQKDVKRLLIHNNPIGNKGLSLLMNNSNIMKGRYIVNLSNISIDDESVELFTNNMEMFRNCYRMYLNGNDFSFKGLKAIWSKTLEQKQYPFIVMKNPSWSNQELEYYLNYCIKKKRSTYDLSNMNINDSHIPLIKQIDYENLDLSNNRISYKGLKELTESFPQDTNRISVFNNPIGDDGVELICKYLEIYDDDYSLNISNIGMSKKGLEMLIIRLKDYKPFKWLDISGNLLDEEELKLMKENKELFRYINTLTITVKENINKSELKSFLKTVSIIKTIKLNGISKKEKKELCKDVYNVI